MRALIVDDEAPARNRLSRLLEKYHDIEVVGEASDGLMALDEIYRLKPNVVFLDIEMPELDGISVADAIKKDGPAVIFVTAYNEHALKAFEVSAIDYLVKPIVESRLEVAIEKVRGRKDKQQDNNYLQLIETLTNQQTTRTASAPVMPARSLASAAAALSSGWSLNVRIAIAYDAGSTSNDASQLRLPSA